MSGSTVQGEAQGDVPEDVNVDLGHPDAHKHAWESTGVIDEGGAHELHCACGAEGSGYGPWSAAPIEETPSA